MDNEIQNPSVSAMRPTGLIIRQKDPSNLEMPFDQLGDFITPTELFYIRSHFPAPELDPATYRLSIRGAVRRVAATQPFQGYWQTSDYAYWDDSAGIPVRRPLAEMKLKAQIARPRVYETLEPGRSYTIFGAVWAGNTYVTEIWLSLDGGASWVQGDFLDPLSRHAWRRWKYDRITPRQPGRYTLLARAKAADQRVQPDKHDPNFGSYMIVHPLPIEVFVAAP